MREGISPPDKIDLVALSPAGDAVQIVIVLDSDWRDSNEGFATLQAKIDHSLGFAVDGQMAAMYPDVAHLRWETVIACHVDPGHRTAAYAEQVAPVVARYGGALRLKGPSEPWPS